jgi:hypothetical protein
VICRRAEAHSHRHFSFPHIMADGLDDQYCNGSLLAQTYLDAKPVYELAPVRDRLAINFRPGRRTLAPAG